ncbi:TraR/DksA family transcriptional regulator [Flexivirga sp. B27]
MPAKKTAATSSSTGRSRVTTALRKASGVVAKAARRSDGSASSGATKKTAKKTAKKAAATKSTAKKAVPAKKTAAAKTAKTTKTAKTAKKAAAKKAAPAKATAAKKAAKKAPTKTTAKKATAKTTAKKTTAKKTAAKTAPVKATAAKKAPAKKAAPVKATPTKTAAKTAPTKKAATKTTADRAAKPAPKTATTRKLKVRDDESPWTAKELAAVRAELETDIERLTHELSGFEDDIAGLIKDSGDGAGDDQADTGAKTFEREHEYSLAQNSRDLLEQSVHALERIDDGTYGVCENCGDAIGKLRLQAFPRATLCLTCKAQQERR